MNSKMRLLVIAITILLSATFAITFAQMVSGNLSGTVYDPSGATVPNATVVAKNDATAVETSTTSTSTGEYRITNLPVGTYTLTVTAAGFAKSQVNGVAITLNVTSTANVTMQIGKTAEAVEVVATAATIDTTTAQLQNTFESQQMMELPTASSGSGVVNLSLLAAGVGTSGAVGLGSGPSVGGQRPRNNNFTVEGVDNNSGSVTGPLVFVPNDAVAEFTFLQNQFSPDFGHSSGGQFNQVIKSGSNQFHGAAYDYLLNRNLDAADNLNFVQGNPLHPRYDDNRFGGTFGGPIKKNKLFFFVNYEYEPHGSVGTGGLLCAPTSAGYNTLASIPGISQTNLSVLKQYMGTASAASTPAECGDSAYPLVGSGNASLGLQTSGVPVEIGLIGFTAPSYSNSEYSANSVDYNISDKDSLRGRFILNRAGFIDTSGFPSQFYTTVPANSYLVALSEYHTFSPTIVNEFRAGFNRYYNVYGVPNIKFPGLDAFPNIVIFELGVDIGPDPNAPQGGIQNQYQLADNLTWTKGAHTIKVGFDGYKQISPQFFTQRARGDYEWSYLSDYLFDYNPDYLAERTVGNLTYYGDRVLLGWFANDAWKVRPNLTVNLGARYEYTTVPYTERLQTANAISNVPGLITFGEPQPMKNAIMPRIGVAYSPGTSGRTSIRAGFGLFYDVLYDNLGLLSLPPQFLQTVDVNGINAGNFLANGGIPPTAATGTLDQADARAYTSGYIPNQLRPETVSWNVGIQHVFHNDYTFESRYVGTHSVHLTVQDDLNLQPVVNSSNTLPLFLQAPSQATLDALPNSLTALNDIFNNGNNGAGGFFVPAFANAGFTGSIMTAFMPWGNSIYHGWANSLTRRFSNGLQFTGAYTWSHAIDDSTADVFSTYVTPRRPEDPRNLKLDRSNSALDHRQRLTFEALYDVPFFKNGNWFLKNIVGNWEIAPIYTYQTGTVYTVQSGVDSNLSLDTAGDRTMVNPSGMAGVGSGVTPLKNSAGDTVAYLANNPNARYIQAGKGVLPNGGRNTGHLNPINDVDASFAKSFNFTETKKLQFSARFINLFNHPQYIGGYISDVAPIGFTSSGVHSFLEPQSGIFNQPSQAFSSNPRQIQLCLKFTF
jgi:Carboxypeptidase regulatory-like domain